jgi:hypothetical protein
MRFEDGQQERKFYSILKLIRSYLTQGPTKLQLQNELYGWLKMLQQELWWDQQTKSPRY